MTLLRRCAIFSLFMLAETSGAWSQSVSLNSGASLTLYGFTFAVTSCSYSSNGVTGCSNSHLDLQGVAAGRGFIEFQVANHTAGSAALSLPLDDNDSAQLQFSVTVSPAVGYPTGSMIKSVTAIETGVRSFSCSSSCSTSVTGSADFSGISIAADPLTTALLNQSGTRTVTSPVDTATPDNGFSFVETLSLSTHGHFASGSTLRLNTFALKFATAPEPASLTVLMLGLGGLALARRRTRRAASQA